MCAVVPPHQVAVHLPKELRDLHELTRRSVVPQLRRGQICFGVKHRAPWDIGSEDAPKAAPIGSKPCTGTGDTRPGKRYAHSISSAEQ